MSRSANAIKRDKVRFVVEGMVECGHDRDFAEGTFKQFESFGSYDSTGQSRRQLRFDRLLVRLTSCAALLNSQLMGFGFHSALGLARREAT